MYDGLVRSQSGHVMSRLLTVIGEEGRSGTVRYGQVSQNDSQLDTVKILDEERFHLRTNQSQDQIESGTDRKLKK